MLHSVTLITWFYVREIFHQLHHHLNHACIFGDGYLSGCVGLAQALLKPMPK
jgi:fructosamine-3-kinase